jgi:hypothetical protein
MISKANMGNLRRACGETGFAARIFTTDSALQNNQRICLFCAPFSDPITTEVTTVSIPKDGGMAHLENTWIWPHARKKSDKL